MRLVLVRHGESVGNFENRLQGQEDYPLTERGRRQAQLTAQRLSAMGAHAVYTSPLLRAHATALTIAENLGVPARLLPDVAEYHFGELSGATYAELRERFAASVRPQERVYPGEEGRDNFLRRVTEAMWGLVEKHPGETVAVVSHGGPIALFCQTVLGLPYRRPMPFAVDNCSLATVRVPDRISRVEMPSAAVLVSLNDTCHLKALAEE